MCELLGMSFNEPVKPNLSVKGLRKKAERNPDGWGMACYPDKSAQVIKEPIEAGDSFLSEFLRNYSEISSKIFIAHVRKSSVGSVSHKNTHPFSRELNGREYVFAHNGSLNNYEKLDTGRFKSIGETDSEHVFCNILNEIEIRQINSWSADDFLWLNQKLDDINSDGKFNCIFSDGEHLFCYHDKNDFNDFCLVQRISPYEIFQFQDNEFEVYLIQEEKKSQKGFIIATNPLTDEEWKSFLPGELMVFKNGEIVYSKTKKQSVFLKSSASGE